MRDKRSKVRKEADLYGTAPQPVLLWCRWSPEKDALVFKNCFHGNIRNSSAEVAGQLHVSLDKLHLQIRAQHHTSLCSPTYSNPARQLCANAAPQILTHLWQSCDDHIHVTWEAFLCDVYCAEPWRVRQHWSVVVRWASCDDITKPCTAL